MWFDIQQIYGHMFLYFNYESSFHRKLPCEKKSGKSWQIGKSGVSPFIAVAWYETLALGNHGKLFQIFAIWYRERAKAISACYTNLTNRHWQVSRQAATKKWVNQTFFIEWRKVCETLLLWGEETGRQLVGHRFSYFSSPFEVWQFSTWLFTTALLETWQIANQQPELNAKVKLRRLCVIQSQQGIQTSRHGYYFVSFVVLLLRSVFSFS